MKKLDLCGEWKWQKAGDDGYHRGQVPGSVYADMLSEGMMTDPFWRTDEYSAGELMIDFDRHRLLLSGKDVHLTHNEYRIVALLGQNAGRVLTYDHIIRELWGPYARSDNQILRVNMANIRRKIEKNPAEPQYIFTEVGVGYRMVENEL